MEARALAVPPTMSFDELYDTHVDYVWRVLRRLGVPASTLEDAVQDVFVAIHRRLGDFEGRSSLRSWVFGFALRVAHNHRRRLQRKGGLLPIEDEVIVSAAAGPLEHAERSERVLLLHALLDRLDPERREVFVLIELEELTASEVAQMLSISLTTVQSRLRSARQIFERELDRRRAVEARRAP